MICKYCKNQFAINFQNIDIGSQEGIGQSGEGGDS